jgi:hypothetical protein
MIWRRGVRVALHILMLMLVTMSIEVALAEGVDWRHVPEVIVTDEIPSEASNSERWWTLPYVPFTVQTAVAGTWRKRLISYSFNSTLVPEYDQEVRRLLDTTLTNVATGAGITLQYESNAARADIVISATSKMFPDVTGQPADKCPLTGLAVNSTQKCSTYSQREDTRAVIQVENGKVLKASCDISLDITEETICVKNAAQSAAAKGIAPYSLRATLGSYGWEQSLPIDDSYSLHGDLLISLGKCSAIGTDQRLRPTPLSTKTFASFWDRPIKHCILQTAGKIFRDSFRSPLWIRSEFAQGCDMSLALEAIGLVKKRPNEMVLQRCAAHSTTINKQDFLKEAQEQLAMRPIEKE